MKEVWFLFRLRRYIKHSRQCFIDYPNTSNFVKNTPLRVVFSTLISVFGYSDETLSLVFDKLHRVVLRFVSYVLLGKCLKITNKISLLLTGNILGVVKSYKRLVDTFRLMRRGEVFLQSTCNYWGNDIPVCYGTIGWVLCFASLAIEPQAGSIFLPKKTRLTG